MLDLRARGAVGLIGRYIPTARNGLVRDHFKKLGFSESGAGPVSGRAFRRCA